MLAGRKRKRKCSTGKLLTASAARPNARWTERGESGRGCNLLGETVEVVGPVLLAVIASR